MKKSAAPSASAGYSGKSLIEKLGLKAGTKAIVIAPPANYGELTDNAAITPKKSAPATGNFDYIPLFVKSTADLARDLPKLEPRLADGGMIWVSWPKKTSKLFVDLTEDGIRKLCLPMSLVDVKVCAVDADWSGLKLYRRKS
ncbi:MAG: DUF3052 domain-containing protein [Hyphomonadaceae bacterium]